MTTLSQSVSSYGLSDVTTLFKEPILAGLGLFMAMLLAPTFAAFLLETREFAGENVWIKPMKFQIALAVYFLTLSAYAHFLPDGMIESRGFRIFAWAVVAATLAEMLWVMGASAFATASHFNQNGVMAIIYPLMGIFAVLLTSVSLVFGWRMLGQGGLVSVIGLSLIATFVLTLVVAGYLSSSEGHFVGSPVTGERVFGMGWSREVGDLRVAHFFAMHAMHVVPLLALGLVAMFGSISAIAGISLVLAYAAFTIFTFVQAILGQPFI